MKKKLLNEGDSIIDTILNFLESFLVDGELKTQAKFLEELKNELNKPIEFDVEKIINESHKKRPKNKGEVHEYIFRIKDGRMERKEITGLHLSEDDKKKIFENWETI